MARPSSLASYSLSQLERIMEKKRRDLMDLGRERAALQKKLDAVDERIRQIGGGNGFFGGVGGGGGRGGRRARNEKSLVEVMAEVLGRFGKAMKVSDIADAVQSAGYRSSSPNFRSIVNQQLIKDKRFTSAERGFYQLKK